MSEHSEVVRELLKDPQKMADKLCPIKGVPFPGGRPGGTLVSSPPSGDTLAEAARAICTLADIVNTYDNADARKLLAFDGLLEVAERAQGVCVCGSTMRPDIRCLSCAAALAVVKAKAPTSPDAPGTGDNDGI